MQYRNLGRTGVKVSCFCLGCAYFGARLEEDESTRLLHAALDAGVNFLDTANAYSLGQSEEIIGHALAGRRSQVVIATKVGRQMGYGSNEWGHSRYHIMAQAEASLRRLHTDYLDLYQLHFPDASAPLEETLRALDDLQRQGKVRYFGTSNHAAWQLCKALWTGDRLGLAPIVSEQPPYSLFNRQIETDVLPFCRAYGLAVVPYSPMAAGWLSGKYQRDQPLPADSRLARRGTGVADAELPHAFNVLERLQALPSAQGVPLNQLALAWVLTQPGITAANFGPRTPEQLQDNLQALNVTLTAEDLSAIDRIVPPATKVLTRVPAPGGIVIT